MKMNLSEISGVPIVIVLGELVVFVDDIRMMGLSMDDANAEHMRRIAPLFFRERLALMMARNAEILAEVARHW